MKSIRDYLNLDETERQVLDKWDLLPVEVLPLFEKMLDGTNAEFEEAERELRAYAEAHGKKREQEK